MEAEKTNMNMCLREENHPVLRRYGRRRYQLLYEVFVCLFGSGREHAVLLGKRHCDQSAWHVGSFNV